MTKYIHLKLKCTFFLLICWYENMKLDSPYKYMKSVILAIEKTLLV